MTTATLMPLPKQQFLSQLGTPLVGGKVYTYAAGTTNPKATYSDPAGTVAQANPILLNVRGEPASTIYWSGNYRVDVRDALNNLVYSVDNFNTDPNGLLSILPTLAASGGASHMGVILADAQAVAMTVEAMLRLYGVHVESFGAVGDGVANDLPAIKNCLTAMKGRGGNVTVHMVKRYMVPSGFKIPSFIRIKGPAPIRYPYNNGTPAPALVANFVDAHQWVIEPETTNAGAVVPYNVQLQGLPDGATYNCAVEDLLIISEGVAPYGAIRMHGCPGSTVRNVSTLGTGIGLLVNECFGGEYQIHGEALYYGAIMWGEANANKLDAYYDQATPRVKVVPADYLFAGISDLKDQMVPTLKMSTNAHYNRPFGLVVGSSTSTSSNDEIAATIEGFSGAVFLYNARSAGFTRLYFEGAANECDFGIVAAYSSLASLSVHAYMSATGTLLDPGAHLTGDLHLNGVISYATFKPAKLDITSHLNIRDVSMAGAAQAVPEPNVRFPDDPGDWIAPALLNAWVNAGGANAPVGYRINPISWETEHRGVAISGAEGQPAYIVPAGYRALYKGSIAAPITAAVPTAGVVIYLATGEVIPVSVGMSASGVDLAGLRFRAEQ